MKRTTIAKIVKEDKRLVNKCRIGHRRISERQVLILLTLISLKDQEPKYTAFFLNKQDGRWTHDLQIGLRISLKLLESKTEKETGIRGMKLFDVELRLRFALVNK